MKNNIITYLSFLLLVAFISSCEDTIDVQLDDAPALVVVDAWLTNEPGVEQVIKLTRSAPYFDNGNPTGITEATVSVGTGGDILIPFDHTSNGDYVWTPSDANGSLADFGESYSLHIAIGEKIYTSTAELNRVPVIDEIRQEVRENELGAVDGGIYCEFIARDLTGPGDSYWIKTYKNGNYLNRPDEINIAFDAGFDSGNNSDGLIFIPPIRELTNPVPDSTEVADEISPWAVGDICKVEIHSISNEAFFFMELARDQILNSDNGIFGEPLANAKGNVSSSDGSNVLGVFNVARVSSLEIEIQ